MSWQPIETAPKDRNMLLSDGKTVCQGGWSSDLDYGADYEGQFDAAGWWSIDCIETPTHWMPMPLPPEATP